MPDNTPKEKVDKFINRPDYPQALRKNATINYHPDKLPENLKKLGNDILAGINNTCDKLEKKK